jgi:hypothetical protein
MPIALPGLRILKSALASLAAAPTVTLTFENL